MNTVEIFVTATRLVTLGGASFKLEACFQNTAGTLSMLGFTKTRLGFTNEAYDVVLDVDEDSTDTMRLRCKGDTGHSIRWMAVVNTVEVTQ